MRWTEAELQAQGYRLVGDTAVPAPRALAADTPEGTLLAEIRQVAKVAGWLTYHTHDSRRSEEGFPDVCLTDGTDLLLYELKTNTGKPTAAQARWLALLAHTGKVECGIWRPRDFAAIVARLTRRRP